MSHCSARENVTHVVLLPTPASVGAISQPTLLSPRKQDKDEEKDKNNTWKFKRFMVTLYYLHNRAFLTNSPRGSKEISDIHRFKKYYIYNKSFVKFCKLYVDKLKNVEKSDIYTYLNLILSNEFLNSPSFPPFNQYVPFLSIFVCDVFIHYKYTDLFQKALKIKVRESNNHAMNDSLLREMI